MDSSKSLIFDQTHLVLVSVKLVLQKSILEDNLKDLPPDYLFTEVSQPVQKYLFTEDFD